MSGGDEGSTPGAGQQTGGTGENENDHSNIIPKTIPADAAGTDQKDLLPDTPAALDFLDRWCGSGQRVLTSIPPDGGRTTTATFTAGERDQMAAWIDERQGRQNIYFTVNEVFGPVTSKPKKTDMAAAVALHVDIDPRAGEDLAKERERVEKVLRSYDPAPTVIIDSGGGFQGFWLFDVPIALPGDSADEARHLPVEDRNRKIETELGGDNCHNIDRIMRLPGTINVPGEKKRKRGRTAAMAQLVVADWSRRYKLEDFPSLAKVSAPGSSAGTARRVSVAADVEVSTLPVSAAVMALIVNGADPDAPGKWDDRSQLVFYVLCEMVRADVPEDVMKAVILDPDLAVSAHVREQKGSDAYADRQIQRGWGGGTEDRSNRPDVKVDYNRLHEMLDNAEGALVASGLPLYQSAGSVVTPVRHAGGTLRLRTVEATAMREFMTRAANFYAPSMDKDGNEVKKPAAPDTGFTQSYVARAGLGTCLLPVCRGQVGHPTIRPDGSLLWDEGWDPDTGLIVDHGGVVFPQVADKPTREEALTALALLKAVIKDFPFIDGPSRSVALSAMLTAVCRRSLDFAPVHAFNAPSPETGKSLLSDIPSMMATGEPAAKHTQDRNPEEDKKTLLGVLQQGDPVLVMDNVERPVEGSTWCLILTSPEWEARWLGANEQRRVLTNVLFIFNGNNIEFRGDMATRAIMATIDARVEEPAARTFDVDLRKDVPRRRGELVAAALTVLRAHSAAGMPGAKSDTRFAGWSRLVRGSLLWLGEPDPWDTRHAVRGGDSARDEAVRMMDALEANFGRKPFAARDVCREAGRWMDEASDVQAALGAAVEERVPSLMDARGAPSSLKVGHALKKMCDRIVRGRTIAIAGQDKLRGNLFAVRDAG